MSLGALRGIAAILCAIVLVGIIFYGLRECFKDIVGGRKK